MRAVIDIKTLECFSSATNAARAYNVSTPSLVRSIALRNKTRGHRFEYLDVWRNWPAEQKEKYTIKHDIFFFDSDAIALKQLRSAIKSTQKFLDENMLDCEVRYNGEVYTYLKGDLMARMNNLNILIDEVLKC